MEEVYYNTGEESIYEICMNKAWTKQSLMTQHTSWKKPHILV